MPQLLVCLTHIQAKMKKEEYNSISDMRKDITLMCNNCRTYNEDGSLLSSDAKDMEVRCLFISSLSLLD